MSRLLSEHNTFWLDHDGAKVKLDGLACRLKVSTQRSTLYNSPVLYVYAEPISKTSKRYREIRAKLGDDWSTNVLDSSVETECDVIRQLPKPPCSICGQPCDLFGFDCCEGCRKDYVNELHQSR